MKLNLKQVSKIKKHNRKTKYLYIVLGMILVVLNSCITNNQLSSDDLKKIKQLEDDYVKGWFADNQQKSVLKVFEENVAFIPHHGDKPVVGIKALREFFWPGGKGGIVNSFNHYPDKIEGNNQIAWLRGRFDINYSWIVDKDTTTTLNEGNYVLIARKQEDDQWKIATFIFNDPVAQVEK